MRPDESLLDIAARRLGSVLAGRWRLSRVIGVGGMSFVYEAVHRNGNRVAVKILRSELTTTSRAGRRFLREGYAANRVGHPGAVTVLDDGVTEEGHAFLVMELLEGETVGARLERHGGRLAPTEALRIAGDVLDVLARAHDAGIVHRDIKPENIFLTNAGAVKVLDFGVASIREADGASVELTLSGASLGTPAYMAPELARGRREDVGPHTDVWAVGATLFKMLAGRFVHLGDSANELIVAAATLPPPSIRSVVPELPEPAADVVDRALAPSRERRFSDAREMQRAVADARSTLPPGLALYDIAPREPVEADTWVTRTDETDGPQGMPHASRRGARRAPWLVVGAISLAGLGAIIAWSGMTAVQSTSPAVVAATGSRSAPAAVVAPARVASRAPAIAASEAPSALAAPLPSNAVKPQPRASATGSRAAARRPVVISDPMLDRRN